MKLRTIIPIFIFLFTLISGILFIYTNEQNQKKKAYVSTTTRADDGCGGCGIDHERSIQYCNDGSVRDCVQETKWQSDIAGCDKECMICETTLQNCAPCPPDNPPPPPPPPPTVPPTTPPPTTPPPTTPPPTTPPPTTPPVTTIPPTTPPVTTIPPTAPPPTTPPPTATPLPTATPTMAPGILVCGTKGCRDNSNPCKPGLVCINGPDENYCSLPQLTDQCKQTGSYDSCCNAGGGGTLVCGTKGCRDSNNPCQSGLTCIQGTDENYCALPALQTSCKNNPTFDNCCALPTTTVTPTASTPTRLAAQPTLPETGEKRLWYIIPAVIILLGLLF